MKLNIPIGTKSEREHTVGIADTAVEYGSGLAAVFATPAMIALMEQTAYMSIEPFLEAACSSVGISINVQHKKATLPGKMIFCQSEVTKVDGKRVHFSIKAFDEKGEIGCAEHVRYVINKEEFMSHLK